MYGRGMPFCETRLALPQSLPVRLALRDMVNKMDLKSGLVVPFYVTVETHGTEGLVLNVEDKVKEVKEDIVVALGLSRSLVTGDGAARPLLSGARRVNLRRF